MWATRSSTNLQGPARTRSISAIADENANLPCVPGVRRDRNPYVVRAEAASRATLHERPLTASLTAKGLTLSKGRLTQSEKSLRPLSASAIDLRKQARPGPGLAATARGGVAIAGSIKDLRAAQRRQAAKERTAQLAAEAEAAGPFLSEAQAQADARRLDPAYRPTLRQPAWLLNEREVLRFYVYFEEPVPEGNAAAAGGGGGAGFRVRRLALHFHLADGKISLDERREPNSGIPQGRFMKPTLVARPDGGAYTPEDFAVGAQVLLHGRRMTVVDADPKTRGTYKAMGRPLGPAQGYPDDGFAQGRDRVEAKRRHAQAERRPKGEFYTKEDRVLRFFCAYKDDRLAGDAREYVLQYYLLNDTVEVTEVRKEGYQRFSNLLRRQKLPRDSLFVPSGYGGAISPRDPNRARVPYVSWEDLRCGGVLSVYGRRLFLHSCDASTLQWYRRQGVVQRPLQLYREGGEGFLESNALEGGGAGGGGAAGDGERDPLAARYGAPVPPYNGYGAADDLYAMGLSLEPNVEISQEGYANFIASENKVLRFEARLVGAGAFNATREFVVNYFLGDDTVSVFEPPLKNSGVVGGLFLARGKYKKFLSCHNEFGTEDYPIGGGRGGRGGGLSRWVRPTDFYAGAHVHFEMPSTGSKLFCLKVLGPDEYTARLVRTDGYHFPYAPVQRALMRLSERLAVAKAPARSLLRRADREGRGYLPEAAFRAALRRMEAEAGQWTSADMDLTEEELGEVCREFRREEDYGHEDPGVLYPDVVDCLAILAPTSIREQEREKQGKSAVTVEEAMLHALQRDYRQRPRDGGGRLRASFRALDPEGRGAVAGEAWCQVLRRHELQGLMSRAKADMVVLDNDTRGDGTLDYHRLCDRVFKGDFDRQHLETTVRLTQRLVKGPLGSPIVSPQKRRPGPALGGGGGDTRRLDLEAAPGLASLAGDGGGGEEEEEEERRVGRLAFGGGGGGGGGGGAYERQESRDDAVAAAAAAELAQSKALYDLAQSKTLKHHLRQVNDRGRLAAERGERRTVVEAMCAFSSAFARMQRKKMLRKHFMAFDTRKTGKVGRKMFEHSIDEVAAEFFIDFDERDKGVLGDYFFPSHGSAVDYDQLLATICLRDFRRAQALRAQVLEDDDTREHLFIKNDLSRQRDFGGTLNLFKT